MENDNLILRPISGPGELALFSGLPYVLNEELADDLGEGRRRADWLWVALRGDRLLARAGWWGRAGADSPFLLDIFDVDDNGADPDRVDVAERLLRTAMAEVVPAGAAAPKYLRMVPPDWREDAAARSAVEDRMSALARTGARPFVERLRFQWSPGTPIAEPAGRLDFRPIRDTEEVLSLMTRVLDGTLDAHSRDDLTRMPAREAAVKHYEDELAPYLSPREWWRVAMLPGGEPVGFVTPGRNAYNPVIGYLAVLPEHRGHGYIDEILAEGTRVLAAQGVPRIRAATDLGNTPMANAFRRAGYTDFERSILMSWP
ncbi:GNAT family N-acetyltransferase [Amycolatopsis saalfeldensis]|uniref:Acetyltransferase (GNAT) family protein n=1 Tax=Amycolatopsis saalfeldensis TaxID=394193 RepID=A0A1H8RDM3_9PSEU|nr:GNAT family N-acetyltransferase [Amycolatopsis saalfeldensis]SEO64466.1 Acetyltransferase (GNAT) family protein [Amycolatopsis saalfeldensis]